MKNPISRIGITTLALAGALLGSLALAAPASASGTGTNGSTATVCVENAGAGVSVRFTETPAARSAITQTVTTGVNGCVTVATSGVAKTSIAASAPSLGLSGTVTYAPTVAAGLVWTDSVATSGAADADPRLLQHKFVQAGRVASSLTLTR